MEPRFEQNRTNSIASALPRFASWLAGGVGWRARALRGRLDGAIYMAEVFVRRTLNLNHPETTLIRDSQTYWNDPSNRHLKQYSHWRGVGRFAEDSLWLGLGRKHLRLYEGFARAVGLKRPLKRVVEWGCGGGMNAVHFGRLADEFFGVDISSASLEECERQMTAVGLHNFRPILIDAANPEAALDRVQGHCDLFLSTYVFELLPSPEYGVRILRIADEMLAAGGVSMIQIKYNDGSAKTKSRTWAYAKNLAWNATYRVEEFWQAAEGCGLTPKLVSLLPRQPLVNDQNYAYFLLQKTRATAEEINYTSP
jgi:SAM-dependent methyltransferase